MQRLLVLIKVVCSALRNPASKIVKELEWARWVGSFLGKNTRTRKNDYTKGRLHDCTKGRWHRLKSILTTWSKPTALVFATLKRGLFWSERSLCWVCCLAQPNSVGRTLFGSTGFQSGVDSFISDFNAPSLQLQGRYREWGKGNSSIAKQSRPSQIWTLFVKPHARHNQHHRPFEETRIYPDDRCFQFDFTQLQQLAF